ncbi:hypothetical protein Kisp01_69990 [Kineosporia sp. NBRC 101677]|nr:hypothetical protein [Kineosporia sp. NBRC 101677]GLY19985.1 hypothetical protein Kisp01_69990 [Kineosporia sp. NBRC 101677]
MDDFAFTLNTRLVDSAPVAASRWGSTDCTGDGCGSDTTTTDGDIVS